MTHEDRGSSLFPLHVSIVYPVLYLSYQTHNFQAPAVQV